MPEFEYLLRYVLSSHTSELINKKKCATHDQKTKFFSRYNENETFTAFFLRKENNTVVPLFNLPIDFNKTEHTLLYGVVATGRTIYANK